jgi:hypothetical protein
MNNKSYLRELFNLSDSFNDNQRKEILKICEEKFKDPGTTANLAILGIDRFYLGTPFLGIVKIITLGGLSIWWAFDIFTALSRTRKYNVNMFKKISIDLFGE